MNRYEMNIKEILRKSVLWRYFADVEPILMTDLWSRTLEMFQGLCRQSFDLDSSSVILLLDSTSLSRAT